MNPPQKICLITSIFFPYTRGGAETVVNNIVQGLKERGYQVIVITISPFKGLGSLWPRKYYHNGIVIYRFFPLNLFSYLNINRYENLPWLRIIWHGLDMFNLHSFLMVKHILKKEKPQIVMTHMLKGVGYLTPLAIKLARIKHIHTLHEVQLITPSGLILKGKEGSWQHKGILTRLYQFFTRLLFNSPSIVISSSKFLSDFHNSHNFFPYSKKIILTNPIIINKTEKEGLKKKQNKLFSFLFLGQIEEHKGILLLIKVFKKLKREVGDKLGEFELLIVGQGSAMKKAKTLAGKEESIKFLGYIPNFELNKIFVQVDVTVVPSLCYENSPTVIFESLSYGIPVLAARIGGIEFIKDNYNGFTFEAGDADDLLKILKFSLENKDKLKNMSENAKKSVEQIGIGKYIQKLEKLI